MDLPSALAATVRRLVAKLPDDRFQSAAEVAEALEGIAAAAQNGVRSTAITRPWRWVVMSGVLVVASALASLWMARADRVATQR